MGAKDPQQQILGKYRLVWMVKPLLLALHHTKQGAEARGRARELQKDPPTDWCHHQYSNIY